MTGGNWLVYASSTGELRNRARGGNRGLQGCFFEHLFQFILVHGLGNIIVHARSKAKVTGALHRMGVHSNVVGARLDELGVEATSVDRALAAAIPVTEVTKIALRSLGSRPAF